MLIPGTAISVEIDISLPDKTASSAGSYQYHLAYTCESIELGFNKVDTSAPHRSTSTYSVSN